MTLRSFQEIAKRRGWPAASVIRGGKESYIFATRPDGQKMQFCSCAAPDTTYFSGTLADDKSVTYQLLKTINVPQPETVILAKDNYQDQLRDLLTRCESIVIKPADGAHGNDVLIGITDQEEAVRAYEYVAGRNPDSDVLVSEKITFDGPEVCVICVGYQFAKAFARIPASVTGDGQHTVPELVDLENATIRTAPYKSNLAFIDKPFSDGYIKKHDLAEYVPAVGEKVRVIETCNIGRGGTVIDVSDEISPEQRAEAEKIAKTVGLPVIGIDYFGKYVIEVNSTPSLYYPVQGPAASYCVEKWVEYLESLPHF